MNKFLIAISMIALVASPAFAGSKHNVNQFEIGQHNRHYNNGDMPPPPNDHNYNYNYNYNYKYKTNNGDWYQNPYLWGSVAGALGQILAPPNAPQYGVPPVYAAPPPPYVGGPGPECGMFYTQVFVPGKGYIPYQTTICN